MTETTPLVYRYRWIVLLVYMLVSAFNQLLWITYAPITSSATMFYNVSDLSIGMLSLSFMAAYLVVAIPASWLIDTHGFRIAVLVGAALTGIFGLARGLVGPNYPLALAAQIGIAVGQPFILNALTKVAVRWFPLQERATASGLGSLAIYAGILVGLVVTPFVDQQVGLSTTLLIYGAGALLAALAFVAFARERPPSPPGLHEVEERASMGEGLKLVVRKQDYLLLMLIFFIGLGIFNSVTTWIEDILRPRGFSSELAGIAGGLMILAGVVGAVVLPALSDHIHRRVPFIILAVAGATLGLAGITFATGEGLLLLSAGILGFFLLSSGPIGFQYGAEIARPTSEGTSTGLLLLMGQVSGIAFIMGMDSLRDPITGAMTLPLIALMVLMVVGLLAATRLHESKLIGG